MNRPTHGSHPDELLSAAASGDLTDAERAALDAHLADCPPCRETLAAFADQRRLVSGMRPVNAPRDLGARVRTGVESGRGVRRLPGWLVGMGASLATVAAAALVILVLGNLPLTPPGGSPSPSPQASSSAEPTASASDTPPSVSPQPSGPVPFLQPGDLGYLSLTGGGFAEYHLAFINDRTGASIEAEPPSGAPISAALSPDRNWLAYITQKGETGANEVWALNLLTGDTQLLGCSLDTPFTERLTWWSDPTQPEFAGRYLGYTLTSVYLGPSSGCPPNASEVGTTDPWLFDVQGELPPERIDFAEDTYVGSFLPIEGLMFMVSTAGATPASGVICWWCDYDPSPLQTRDVFLPVVSPDGNRALFWRGTMGAQPGGGWSFVSGGLPYLSGDFRSTGPASPWIGQPLFADLAPVGGEGFESGRMAWGPDNDLVAFWDGAWLGAPQSTDGRYPSRGVYVGRASEGLTAASLLPVDLPDDGWIVDVAFAPDGASVVVTIGLSSAGIGDPPSSMLLRYALDGGEPIRIGGGGPNPSWDGPVVFGP